MQNIVVFTSWEVLLKTQRGWPIFLFINACKRRIRRCYFNCNRILLRVILRTNIGANINMTWALQIWVCYDFTLSHLPIKLTTFLTGRDTPSFWVWALIYDFLLWKRANGIEFSNETALLSQQSIHQVQWLKICIIWRIWILLDEKCCKIVSHIISLICKFTERDLHLLNFPNAIWICISASVVGCYIVKSDVKWFLADHHLHIILTCTIIFQLMFIQL